MALQRQSTEETYYTSNYWFKQCVFKRHIQVASDTGR